MNLPKFDFVATSYEADCEKPNPKIFKYAEKISKQKFAPEEALHIGNEVEKDLEGAAAAGWSSLLISPEAKREPHFKHIEDFWNQITTKEIQL